MRSTGGLRIAVDARNLIHPRSGIARSIENAVMALSPACAEIHVCLPMPLHLDFRLLSEIDNVHLHVENWPTVVGRIVWGRTRLPAAVRRIAPDVFWAPAHRLSREVARTVPTVLTVHDLVWKFAPETMLAHRRLADCILTGRAVKLATRITTISDRTRDDLAVTFPLFSDKMSVVPNIVLPMSAIGSSDILAQLGVEQPYCLFVGTLEPRKNLPRTLAAFASLPGHLRRNLRLVVVGARGWRANKTERALEEASANVMRLGSVNEVTLAALYKNAEFLVMPSLYEGFGYPIIEAQQFGKRVLTSRDSAMAEIVGGTAVLVDPRDISSIADGMLKCLAAPSDFKSDDVINNAERFDAPSIIPLLLDSFKNAILEWHSDRTNSY